MAGSAGRHETLPTVVTLTVDGVEIRCRVAGTERPDQDPVILLTGVGETPFDSCAFLFLMLARNYRVVSIDFGGLARAPGQTPQMDHLVEQVQGAIDQIVPGRRVSVIGYSTGALVAVAFAASHRAAARVVLVAGWLKSTARQRLFIEIWQRLSGQGAAALGDFARFAALSSSFIDDNGPDALDRVEPIRLSRFTDAQVDFMLTVDLTEIAPRIAVPSLVIGSAHDDIIPIGQARALFAAIPDARYVELDSGHAMVVERPAEVLSHVDIFLRDPARHPPGAIIVSACP